MWLLADGLHDYLLAPGDHGRRYTNTAASGGGLTSHM
jgi:hypothetical protein